MVIFGASIWASQETQIVESEYALSNVEASRGEPRYAFQSITTRPAPVRNPSNTIAYTNVPVAIRVGFAEGECPTPDHLKLIDPSGVAVPFQWEGGYHPFDESSIEFWDDGSLRAGNVWAMATLAAGETKLYTVNCYRQPQGQVFAPVVVYTAISGTVDELDTPRMRCRFESAQAWNLRRYQDKANANFDLFNGTNGVVAAHINAGGYYSSYDPADVTLVSHGRVNSAAFGYGVVYQDYETVWDWVPAPSVRDRMRYRVFANGSCKIDRKIVNSADLPLDNYRFMTQHFGTTTGITSTYDAGTARLILNYAGSSFIFSARRRQVKWGGDTETWSTLQGSPNVGELNYGFWGNPTTTMQSGGSYRIGTIISPVTDVATDDWVRLLHPAASFSSVTKPVSDLRDIARHARILASQAIPILEANAPTWNGALAMARLLRDGLIEAAPAALADYQAWTTARGITPDSAASYFNVWNSGSAGIEFQGRNTHVLWWLRKAFIERGETANQTLVESYIHAYADAIVQMEVASGGAGKLQLSGTASDVYNARTAGMAGLAASLNFAPDATRQATLDRLSSAYNAASFGGAGLKWSYSPGGSWLVLPTIHYYTFQTFDLLLAKHLVPGIVLPDADITALIREATGPNGIVDEWMYNYHVSRRGIPGTHMLGAGALCLAPVPDYGAAYEMVRHLSFENTLTQAVDGWPNDGMGGSEPQDLRALAEVVLTHGL